MNLVSVLGPDRGRKVFVLADALQGLVEEAVALLHLPSSPGSPLVDQFQVSYFDLTAHQ